MARNQPTNQYKKNRGISSHHNQQRFSCLSSATRVRVRVRVRVRARVRVRVRVRVWVRVRLRVHELVILSVLR